MKPMVFGWYSLSKTSYSCTRTLSDHDLDRLKYRAMPGRDELFDGLEESGGLFGPR
jgi:hypothetical protein